jgi:phosphate transport system permease protein
MTEAVVTRPATTTNGDMGMRSTTEIVAKGLKRRHATEKRFQLYGLMGIGFAVACLVFLFTTIIGNALPGFQETRLRLEVELSQQEIDPEKTGNPEVFRQANYRKLVLDAMGALFPDVKSRQDRRELGRVVSSGASFILRDRVLADPSLIGKTVSFWFPLSADLDQFFKGGISGEVKESERRVSDKQIRFMRRLVDMDRVEKVFNTTLFSAGDSREPELAGFWGAIVGSFYTMIVTLLLSFPIGVAAAVYLEEFAPKNRWTQLIEVNINNLAAVPSIVFGLLGLAVFLNFFELPRSAPLVGGMVLALMTLPTVIIAGRAALKAVPPSIREAAFGIGASRWQTIVHHVLPLAMPGVMTGTIIGMAQALGETAPLLMIGMVAFVVDIPGGFVDSATVMPVQIYLWSDAPERAFIERTAAATLVLLGFLVIMNALAVVLRKKFERKW